MNVELSIIKLLLTHENYIKYNVYISSKDFSDEVKYLYNILCSYYAVNEQDLAVQDFANLVFANNPKDKEYYKQCLEFLDGYIPVESTVVALIESLKQQKLLQELSLASYEALKDKDKLNTVTDIYSKLSQIEVVDDTEDIFVTDDLESLINTAYGEGGLYWRLPCLNDSLGPLRKGNFGFLFSRPEGGKTTFLASEVTHMLGQTDKPIIWFNI